MTAEDAVELLLQRFPIVAELGVSRGDLFDLAPPYYAYGQFAELIKTRAIDDDFMIRASEFATSLPKAATLCSTRPCT